MRVCLCISHFAPVESGAELQARRQGRELARRGHEVHVLTRHVPGLPAEATIDGMTVHRRVRPLELGPLFGLSFVAGMAAELCRLSDAYDLIHCHQGLWEACAAGLVAPALGKPSVIQPAGSGLSGEGTVLQRTRGSAILRRLILRNTHWIAISAATAAEWIGLGVPPERMTIRASGVDPEEFAPGPSTLEDLLPPRPRVVFVGRLHPLKNLDTLLAAWPPLARRGAHLILVGAGPERPALVEQAARLGTAASVHFVGAVAEPLQYLRAADVFVLPSRAEGMSNALLEAMACGLPCVVSRVGGNIDLVEDGRTGWTVDPQDPAGLAAAVAAALDDPARAARRGSAARRRVVDQFAIPRIVGEYQALYERLVVRGK